LYTIEPPSKEKRAKPSIKQKPKLKKPLKRSRVEEQIPDRPRRNVKRQKDDIVEVKQEPQDDILDLSSLSELSSAEEIFDSDDDSNTKNNKSNTGKSTKAKQSKSCKKDNTSKAKSNEKQVTDDVEVETPESKEKGKEKEIEAKVDLDEETAEETEQEKDQPTSPAITEVDDEPTKIVDQVDKCQENIPPTSSETMTSTPDAETNDTHQTKPSKTTDTDTIVIKEDVAQDAPSLSLEPKKTTFQSTQKNNSTIGPQQTLQTQISDAKIKTQFGSKTI
jgi:hypothetical protein